nr:MAG TPA: hypothetical protein [Caudoviricetes sp.]
MTNLDINHHIRAFYDTSTPPPMWATSFIKG